MPVVTTWSYSRGDKVLGRVSEAIRMSYCDLERNMCVLKFLFLYYLIWTSEEFGNQHEMW
jgi:hypothetical protein